jgi:hypothetical protein
VRFAQRSTLDRGLRTNGDAGVPRLAFAQASAQLSGVSSCPVPL